MKDDESIQREVREDLSPVIASNKWISLQRQFKAAFYNYVDKEQFPYYNEMLNLFNSYAKDHLNSTFSLMGRTVEDADLTAFVGDLLDRSVPDVLRCETSKENILSSNASTNQSFSEASRALNEFSKLPKSSLCVKEATMKIVPNTPFSRTCQLSTIVNQRNALILSQRHESEIKPKIKRRRLSMSPDHSTEVTILQQGEFHIEALNECNLSKVNFPRTYLKSFKQSLPVMEFSMEQLDNDSTLKFPLIKSSQSTIGNTQSVLDIPSITDDSIDELGNISERSLSQSIPGLKNDIETPPSWFMQFFKRYDDDMKRINTKLEEMSTMLTRNLAQGKLLSLNAVKIQK